MSSQCIISGIIIMSYYSSRCASAFCGTGTRYEQCFIEIAPPYACFAFASLMPVLTRLQRVAVRVEFLIELPG